MSHRFGLCHIGFPRLDAVCNFISADLVYRMSIQSKTTTLYTVGSLRFIIEKLLPSGLPEDPSEAVFRSES